MNEGKEPVCLLLTLHTRPALCWSFPVLHHNSVYRTQQHINYKIVTVIIFSRNSYTRYIIKPQRLASSVEDPPLVLARTTGIPKPAHSNPPVPELIPLSAALPMMKGRRETSL